MPIAPHDFVSLRLGQASRCQSFGHIAKVAIVLKPIRHGRETRCRGTAFAVVDRFGPAPCAHPFHDAVRLVLAQVRADPDMIFAHQVCGAGNHIAEALQRAVRTALQVMRIYRKTKHPAALAQRL